MNGFQNFDWTNSFGGVVMLPQMNLRLSFIANTPMKKTNNEIGAFVTPSTTERS